VAFSLAPYILVGTLVANMIVVKKRELSFAQRANKNAKEQE